MIRPTKQETKTISSLEDLKEAIHQIQDGIENVHGDVSYGERQYLFLFKEWVLKHIGADLAYQAPKQQIYRCQNVTGKKFDKPEITIWLESQEFTRGWNARGRAIQEKLKQLTKDV